MSVFFLPPGKLLPDFIFPPFLSFSTASMWIFKTQMFPKSWQFKASNWSKVLQTMQTYLLATHRCFDVCVFNHFCGISRMMLRRARWAFSLVGLPGSKTFPCGVSLSSMFEGISSSSLTIKLLANKLQGSGTNSVYSTRQILNVKNIICFEIDASTVNLFGFAKLSSQSTALDRREQRRWRNPSRPTRRSVASI